MRFAANLALLLTTEANALNESHFGEVGILELAPGVDHLAEVDLLEEHRGEHGVLRVATGQRATERWEGKK